MSSVPINLGNTRHIEVDDENDMYASGQQGNSIRSEELSTDVSIVEPIIYREHFEGENENDNNDNDISIDGDVDDPVTESSRLTQLYSNAGSFLLMNDEGNTPNNTTSLCQRISNCLNSHLWCRLQENENAIFCKNKDRKLRLVVAALFITVISLIAVIIYGKLSTLVHNYKNKAEQQLGAFHIYTFNSCTAIHWKLKQHTDWFVKYERTNDEFIITESGTIMLLSSVMTEVLGVNYNCCLILKSESKSNVYEMCQDSQSVYKDSIASFVSITTVNRCDRIKFLVEKQNVKYPISSSSRVIMLYWSDNEIPAFQNFALDLHKTKFLQDSSYNLCWEPTAFSGDINWVYSRYHDKISVIRSGKYLTILRLHVDTYNEKETNKIAACIKSNFSEFCQTLSLEGKTSRYILVTLFEINEHEAGEVIYSTISDVSSLNQNTSQNAFTLLNLPDTTEFSKCYLDVKGTISGVLPWSCSCKQRSWVNYSDNDRYFLFIEEGKYLIIVNLNLYSKSSSNARLCITYNSGRTQCQSYIVDSGLSVPVFMFDILTHRSDVSFKVEMNQTLLYRSSTLNRILIIKLG